MNQVEKKSVSGALAYLILCGQLAFAEPDPSGARPNHLLIEARLSSMQTTQHTPDSGKTVNKQRSPKIVPSILEAPLAPSISTHYSGYHIPPLIIQETGGAWLSAPNFPIQAAPPLHYHVPQSRPLFVEVPLTHTLGTWPQFSSTIGGL